MASNGALCCNVEVPRGKTVLLSGATGLVGNLVLQGLLLDERFSRVVTISRRPLTHSHAKLESIVCEFDRLDSIRKNLSVDCAICCLGTTIKVAGSRAQFAKVDHDYPLQFAELALKGGASQFILLSALGADLNSSVFYNKTKGRVEQSIRAVGFVGFDVLRPSLLLGNRDEFRFTEEVFKVLSPLLKLFLRGRLEKYCPIKAEQVAQAMVAIATSDRSGNCIHENDQLFDL